jgi:hypothetical protein
MTQLLTPSSMLLAALVACGQSKWIAPDQLCPGELRPVWMANPNYSMCVVTSFRTRDLRTWTRERDGNQSDVLTVHTDVAQAQIDLTGGWPPHVAAGNAALAESVTSRTDSSTGIVSHTEVLERPGGDGTVHLSFVSATKADGRYMLASGQAANAAALDTLLIMFRTVRRAQTPNPNVR